MTDRNKENILVRDLESFVKTEAYLWGDNVAKTYFEPAEWHMDSQWEVIRQFLAPYPIDYTNTMELACGHGRNSERLADLSQNMILVDVNPENLLFCKK